ncbi:hypothetical protein WN48_00652, partial [Eufriesea mexicana]
KPLYFRKLIAFPVLAKVAQILATEDSVPNNIRIACLKCIGNSCFNSYLHKKYDPINIEKGKYSYKLYSILGNNENLKEMDSSYPFDSHFPYEGVIEWTTNFITSCKLDSQLEDENIEILRLNLLKSIQMIGKQSNNYFTPLQKLSEIAITMQGITDNEPGTRSNDSETKTVEQKLSSAMDDIQGHPAFGVKASLIRIIGNMSYKNKEYQDLVSINFLFYL